MAPLATGIETVSGKLKRRQPRKLLTRPERGQRRRQIEWPDLMTARRGQQLAFEHARPVQDCCKSIEAGRRFAGLADPSPTIPAGACAGPCIGAPHSRKPATPPRLARRRPPPRARLSGFSSPDMRVCRSSKSTSRESAPVPEPSRFQAIRLDERRRGSRPRERRRRRPLKKPIATGRRLSYAWVYSLAQPDRTGLQHRAARIQIPRMASGRAHLDSRGLEETSVGNYSEQAPADSKLRMDSANAIDGRSVGVFGEEAVAQARGPQYDTPHLRIASARR